MCGVFSSLLVCLRLISFLCLGGFWFCCLFVCFLSICCPFSVHCSSVDSNDLFLIPIRVTTYQLYPFWVPEMHHTANPKFSIHAQSLSHAPCCPLHRQIHYMLLDMEDMHNLNSQCNLLGKELYYKFVPSCVYLSVYVYTFFFRRMEKSYFIFLHSLNALKMFPLPFHLENNIKLF